MYSVIAQALQFCQQHQPEQPSLAAIAAHVGLSPTHLQRTFSLWAGVSPKQYLQFLTKEYALQQLREQPVMQVALDSGLSGTGRLHDLLLSWEGVTPGDVRRAGSGLCLQHGEFESPFGRYWLVVAPRGICRLVFVDTDADRDQAWQALRDDWPQAQLQHDPLAVQPWADALFARSGPSVAAEPVHQPLRLWMKGSRFQHQVWQALLRIPEGRLCSYQQLADAVGKPSAVRAVASAVARNPIGYLIPCHRVIRSSGEFGDYRWGRVRKQCLIGWEASQGGRR